VRWGKVRAVMVFELLSTVKSKSWLILTFGMPVFLLLYGIVVAIPGLVVASRARRTATHGVVDDARVLGSDELTPPAAELPPELRSALERTGRGGLFERSLSRAGVVKLRRFESREAATQALTRGEIASVLRLPPDYLATGVVERFSLDKPGVGGSDVRRVLAGALAERLIRGRLPPDLAVRVRTPIASTRDFVVTGSGAVRPSGALSRIARLLVPLLFAMLLLFSVLMTGGALVQATGIEKENKVAEVLLSSAAADEILMGKLLGAGTAGLLQITVWFSFAGASGSALAAQLASLGVAVPWGAIAVAFLFFPAAYLFFGSLMLGTGALGGNAKEANQLGMLWALLVVTPFPFVEALLSEPGGTLARVLTWLPFAAPITVVLRTAADPGAIAWWEIAGSFLVLVASTWLAVTLAARLFRVGLLLSGARPSLRALLRQARLG